MVLCAFFRFLVLWSRARSGLGLAPKHTKYTAALLSCLVSETCFARLALVHVRPFARRARGVAAVLVHDFREA